MSEKVLTKNVGFLDQKNLVKYELRGGYTAIKKAIAIPASSVIDEIKNSGLRGRGGAGFPTGVKWGFVSKNSGKPIYLLNNADESEPGTFKDRLLLEGDPHLVIEGMMIAAWALGVHWSAVYIRGEYGYAAEIMSSAVKEAYVKGYLGHSIFGSNFNLDIVIHRGAGAYICGEETALIESIEGKKGQPRNKPPFPAISGLYGCPTVVNNVETLASLPWIINNGASAYKKMGTEKSPGTKLFSVSGHVNKPGIYEVELGYPLLKFIENECGGIRNGKKLKAVIPGGSSTPVLRAEELLTVNLDYESIKDAGSMLGSGGFIVMDEDTNMVDVVLNLQHFYTHESCGQCSPCREGGHWIEKILWRLAELDSSSPAISSNGSLCYLPRSSSDLGSIFGESHLFGIAAKNTAIDLSLVQDICKQIAGHTICPFGDALVTPVLSFLKKFPEDFKKKFGA